MEIDFETISLAEIIRLQDDLSQLLHRRFGRSLALVFTDVEGSTAYFARFGDEAGRALQQRHLDLLQVCLDKHGGKLVDTAGDGAFTFFEQVENACAAMRELQSSIAKQNVSRPPEHHLKVRSGIHWGPVLTDGRIVTGDSVNFCSRVAGTGKGGRDPALQGGLQRALERGARRLLAAPAAAPQGLRRAGLHDAPQLAGQAALPHRRPRRRRRERRSTCPLQDTITFGRLKGSDVRANDVVLALPDAEATLNKISRWHFELKRMPDGFVLRPLSTSRTEVDGKPLTKGEEAKVAVGTVVQLAGVLTLKFLYGGGDEKATIAV